MPVKVSLQHSFSEVFTYFHECLENKDILRLIAASSDAKDPHHSASTVRVPVMHMNNIIVREPYVFQVSWTFCQMEAWKRDIYKDLRYILDRQGGLY